MSDTGSPGPASWEEQVPARRSGLGCCAKVSLLLLLLFLLGGGYSLIRDQGMELFVGAGGNLNDERYVGEPTNRTGEIRAQIRFDAFDVGDLDVYTDVTSFVTPTGGGRFRTNIDARLAWELIDDFVLGFNVTERLDSKPPSETATKRDYQYAFSVGWSWG